MLFPTYLVTYRIKVIGRNLSKKGTILSTDLFKGHNFHLSVEMTFNEWLPNATFTTIQINNNARFVQMYNQQWFLHCQDD